MSAGEVMAAWERGDPEGAWEFYANDCVMRLPGRGTLAGAHTGRAAVIAAIQALLARTDDATPWSRCSTGSRPTTGSRCSCASECNAATTRSSWHVTLHRVREGEIVEIDIFEHDQYEVDEFFG